MPALEIELRDHCDGLVARAVVHGDKALNVVDETLLREATAMFVELGATPDLRCVTLCGATERAFIGGANLHALRALTPRTAASFIRSIHEFCAALRQAPVPVIAMLRGYCLGAGLEIAAAADIRIGDRSVQCGMPEVRVGVPSVIEAALLPTLIGTGKARELMLRGNIIDAEQARAIGLLQHVVDAADLEALALTISADIVAAGPRAIAAQKRLFAQWETLPMPVAIERGVEAFVAAYGSDEPQRAIDAFFAAPKAGAQRS